MEKKKYIAFDLFAYFRRLKKAKWTLMLMLLMFGALGVGVAFSIPRIYKSSVMLAPESSGGNSLSSSLSSMASLVGLNKSFMNSEDAIFPEIYPDVMQSTNFLVSLFPVQVETRDGKINCDYYTYLLKKQKTSWLDIPKMKLEEFLKKYKKDDVGKPKTSGDDAGPDPFYLTKDEDIVAKSISSNINCSVDKKTSVITIEVTDQDPLIAATLADTLMSRLQVFITDYRTKKAIRDLDYIRDLYTEAKDDYTNARKEYAAFCDANQDVILQEVQSEMEEMENEMQLKYNIYTQLAEQLQMAQAKVQERTPVYTIVQNASVPVKHSNKPKVLILAVFLFIGFVLHNIGMFLRHGSEILVHEKPAMDYPQQFVQVVPYNGAQGYQGYAGGPEYQESTGYSESPVYPVNPEYPESPEYSQSPEYQETPESPETPAASEEYRPAIEDEE